MKDSLKSLMHSAVDMAKMKNKCGEVVKTVVIPNDAVKTVKVMVEEPRLFEQGKPVESSNTNFVLVGFLPITAIVSFVGGRLYARRNAQARACVDDEEPGLE